MNKMLKKLFVFMTAVLIMLCGLNAVYAVDEISFSGEMITSWSKSLKEYHMRLSDNDDYLKISDVKYINLYAITDSEGNKYKYFLGEERVEERGGTYSVSNPDKWFNINGSIITLDCAPKPNSAAVTLEIPVTLLKESTEISGTLICSGNADNTAVSASIEGIKIGADVLSPDVFADERGTITFAPYLCGFDDENGTASNVFIRYDFVTISPDASGVYDMSGILGISGLYSDGYFGLFAAHDASGAIHYSNPIKYVTINSFTDDVEIGLIKPMAYTGSEIKPEVKLYCGGVNVLEENTDYSVSFSNNTEKGTARVTVRSLMDEENLSGTLTSEFTICDERDISRECLKLISNDPLKSVMPERYLTDQLSLCETAYMNYAFYNNTLSDTELSKLAARKNELYEIFDYNLENNEIEISNVCNGLYSNGGENVPLSLEAVDADETFLSSSKYTDTLLAVRSENTDAQLVRCSSVSVYAKSNDTRKNAKVRRGENVMIKIHIPSGYDASTASVYKIGDDTHKIKCNIKKNGSESDAFILTNEFGTYALFAAPLAGDGKVHIDDVSVNDDKSQSSLIIDTTITNGTGENVSCGITAAVYNKNGTLLSVRSESEQYIGKGKQEHEFILGSDENAYLVKIMVWNDMKPLASYRALYLNTDDT